VSAAAWGKTLGGGIVRTSSATGATVTVRRAWDGGTRVSVSRPVEFGRDVNTGRATYVHTVTHERRFA